MKTGNGQPQDAGMDMPPAPMDVASAAPQDDMMGGGEMSMDNMGGEMPMADEQIPNGGSEFDTNFDAGVEADEDADPEKYLQQLTGKLSTELNKFNSENGDNSGLNKYVAKMIVKAATKNMDDSEKKEIIKAINTSQNPEPADESEPEQTDDMGGEMSDMQGDEMQNMETPMQEKFISKKKLMEMVKRCRK